MISTCLFLMVFYSKSTYSLIKTAPEVTPVTYTFKEYQYKDTPKNEMTFREFESACEQSNACNHLTDLSRTRCVRECTSPSCYRELYQDDPLLRWKSGSYIQYSLKKRLPKFMK